MSTNLEAKNEVLAQHAKRKFGNRMGNLVKMSHKSRYAYDDDGFCHTIMVIGCSGSWTVKEGKVWRRFYGAKGLLCHEEKI